jgi:very-short-patch-repair endonuclease
MSIPLAKSIGEETLALHFRAYSVPFEREYEFHPNRKWRFDFYLREHGIAVEVEGGMKKIGRHQREDGFEADVRKYNSATIQGIKVLRYTTRQVTSGEAINEILAAIGAPQQ